MNSPVYGILQFIFYESLVSISYIAVFVREKSRPQNYLISKLFPLKRFNMTKSRDHISWAMAFYVTVKIFYLYRGSVLEMKVETGVVLEEHHRYSKSKYHKLFHTEKCLSGLHTLIAVNQWLRPWMYVIISNKISRHMSYYDGMFPETFRHIFCYSHFWQW